MAFKDLNLGKKMALGYAVPLLLVALLGIVSYYEIITLLDTNKWVNHTHSVIQKAKNIEKLIIDMETGERGFLITGKKLFLEPYNDAEKVISTLTSNLKLQVSDNPDQVERLNDIHSKINLWRTNVINPEIAARYKLNEGKITKHDISIMIEKGEGKAMVDALRNKFSNFISVEEMLMSERASNVNHRASLILLTVILGTTTIIILSFVISIFIVRSVTIPLRTAVDLADRVARGKLDVKIDTTSKDETGDLLNSMKLMLEQLISNKRMNQNQNWLKDGQTKLSDEMRGNKNIKDLSRDIINHVSKYTEAQTGRIFIRENDKFILEGSYNFVIQESTLTEILPRQGLIGEAILKKKAQVISDIPKDYIKAESLRGHMAPKTILIFPLLANNIVEGVLELSFPAEVSILKMELLNLISENIAIAINSSKQRKQSDALLLETQKQSKILKASEKELQEHSVALRASNKEVKIKASELTLASKYKSEFLANMSHELRTPLNSLLLLSKNLSKNKKNNLTKDQLEDIEIIYDGSNSLLELINDIMDLSKVEAGMLSVHVEKNRFNDIISSMKSYFNPIAKEKNLSFNTLQQEGTSEYIFSDKQRIEQILKNFLSNAFKFTPKGSITLEVHSPKSGMNLKNKNYSAEDIIAISVTDTGIGIPKDQQDAIFETFQQADGATSRKYGGTGLGLSISKELSNLLEGEIQLESKKGKGSTFTLYLPLKSKTLNKQILPSSPPSNPTIESSLPKPHEESINLTSHSYTALNDRKILIVDDDMRNVYALESKLSEAGMTLGIAKDGLIAIETLQKDSEYEAIIIDMMIPMMNGYDTIKKIRLIENYKDTPIIALTTESMPDDRNLCIDAGASDYIAKPVEIEKLLSSMNLCFYEHTI